MTESAGEHIEATQRRLDLAAELLKFQIANLDPFENPQLLDPPELIEYSRSDEERDAALATIEARNEDLQRRAEGKPHGPRPLLEKPKRYSRSITDAKIDTPAIGQEQNPEHETIPKVVDAELEIALHKNMKAMGRLVDGSDEYETRREGKIERFKQGLDQEDMETSFATSLSMLYNLFITAEEYAEAIRARSTYTLRYHLYLVESILKSEDFDLDYLQPINDMTSVLKEELKLRGYEAGHQNQNSILIRRSSR